MRVVLFGLGKLASLAWYCLTHDSPHEVVAFTVDAAFRDADQHNGLPVVDFEEVVNRFPPGENAMLIPLGARAMNRFRAAKYAEAGAKGYGFITYVSSRALTWPDLTVGENSMIFEGVIVQPFAEIGRNTILRSGAMVSHHAIIGDHCFVATRACISGAAIIEERCFIGSNATIRDRVKVGAGCLVGAAAAVIEDTAPDGIYVGVPARRLPQPASERETP